VSAAYLRTVARSSMPFDPCHMFVMHAHWEPLSAV
jgi:hypothetical protein